MDGVDMEMPAAMADVVHLAWIGVDAGDPIAAHGVVIPAPLPQLVADVEILIGEVVAVVVGGQRRLAGGAGAAVEYPVTTFQATRPLVR